MGIENITMPQLGESVTEGTISSWFISPGTEVKKYDPIAEVISDKVTAEVPSSFTGVIKEIVAKEGETLAVGEIICTIETQEVSTLVKNSEPISLPEKEEIYETSQKQRYSPAVLKLSQEHGIKLNEVTGTGRGGRITRKDILLFIENQSQITSNHSNKPNLSTTKDVGIATFTNQELVTTDNVVSTDTGDIEIPVTGIRKAIATNMLKAKQEIPHAWLMVEVDVTNLVQYRDSIKEDFLKKEGFSLTYFAFFVKAVAQALKEYPQMNSMWAGDKIVQKKDIHLSIAVSTEDALFVPVIKYADEKTIKGIAKDIAELARKARTGKLLQEDMTGGTFTVNNTGSFGSVQSMGIINYPQAAILQVESIVKRPVVMENGMFAARDIVNLCLSLDHRILDGLICGRFLKRVKEILENISKENTNIY